MIASKDSVAATLRCASVAILLGCTLGCVVESLAIDCGYNGVTVLNSHVAPTCGAGAKTMSAKKKIRNSGKTSTLTKTRIDPITVAGDGSLLVGMEQQTEISRADKRPSGRTLQALKSLIVRMESEDLSTGNDDGAFVTAQASRNARQFVDQIADEYELPKVAPDGDGGLVFAWEKDGAPSVVVGFADDIIFAVNAPGTSNSRHFDEAAYRDAVPSEILRILPKRTA